MLTLNVAQQNQAAEDPASYHRIHGPLALDTLLATGCTSSSLTDLRSYHDHIHTPYRHTATRVHGAVTPGNGRPTVIGANIEKSTTCVKTARHAQDVLLRTFREDQRKQTESLDLAGSWSWGSDEPSSKMHPAVNAHRTCGIIDFQVLADHVVNRFSKLIRLTAKPS
ncbi:hypothetical protein WN48_10788 [Eufriesea mexicana]|uniref:Uncharacterized protein n=1 Tax=Eufriesea mexicana TaxID=516756 RepID=A0A310SQT0_9HYME|nr:hypothetical protein WN48_10788 [Eufriesea mexicana]